MWDQCQEQEQQYLQQYMGAVLKARNQGINVNGYFVWSFTDNFEWAEGYHPRFGLVYIDYKTQQRIIKNSGLWYRDFLQTRETPKKAMQRSSVQHSNFFKP